MGFDRPPYSVVTRAWDWRALENIWELVYRLPVFSIWDSIACRVPNALMIAMQAVLLGVVRLTWEAEPKKQVDPKIGARLTFILYVPCISRCEAGEP